ncbi:MAG: SRPBCC family protein [Cognatishimia sp.]
MAKVTNTFHYAASPERVWNMVTDYTALSIVCKKFLRFDGLPEGRIYTGQKVDVEVSLFGRLPAQPYHMEVVLCDDNAMRFESKELGAGVKKWNHTLSIEPDGEGSRLVEQIKIEAGLLTPLFKLWAGVLYRGRHEPRQELLASGAY